MPPIQKLTDQNELVKTEQFPHASFPFEAFNPVQSRVFEVYEDNVNLIIAAATSAGKTVCAEMLLSHEVRVRGGKGMYLAPLKALSQEKIDDWTDDKHHFSDLNLSICTGDYRLTASRKKELEESNLILMTSEMLNSFVYDTDVFCHKDGNVWVDKIGRLVEESVDCDVFSYHVGKGILPTPITARIKCGEKHVFKLNLRGGRSVKMTADHNVYLKNGKTISEVKLSEIKTGDRIAISKGFNTPSSNSFIDLLPILRKSNRKVHVYGEIVDVLLSLSTDCLHELCPLGIGCEKNKLVGTSRRRSGWRRRGCLPLYRITDKCLEKYGNLIEYFGLYHSNAKYNRYMDINKDVSYFFGFYAAEGSVSENHVMCGQKGKLILNKISESFQGVVRNHAKPGCYLLDICDSILVEICKEFGDCAKNKKCPDWIFTWTKEDILSFLKGFIDGDGSKDDYRQGQLRKNNNVKRKRYWSSSLQLLEGLRNLLILTGKQGYICKSGEGMYCLGEWSHKHLWQKTAKSPIFPELSFVSVKSVVPCGVEDVYDLEVQPDGVDYKVENFIGACGGILLHNSRCRNDKSEKNQFLREIGTLVVDESHLLTVPGRGDHLEAGLMKLTMINPNVRIVFLSATMPNVDEISEWVSYALTGQDTALLTSEYRPCPLTVHYEEYWDMGGTYEENESQKVNQALAIVESYPDDKFLIFAHTKRTGELMKRQLKALGEECEFHNADLEKKKRVELEHRFKTDPKFRCIVATSTLAWGCYSHGSKLSTPSGRLIDVVDIGVGTELLCPINDITYGSRKVVRIRDFNEKQSYIVKLESGEEMEVSSDHIFFGAIGRNYPDWIQVGDISKGDYLARPSNTHLWNKVSNFNVFWYLAGFAFGDGCLCDVGFHADGSKKAVLDLCLGKEDGCLCDVGFADGSKKAVLDLCLGKEDCFSKYIKNLFNNFFDSELECKFDINNVVHLTTKKKSIVDQFLKLLPVGRKCGNDDLPKEIYDNQEYICSFLQGLFDADGGIEDHGNNNWSIDLSNISKHVIESTREILIGFGIFSSFGKKRVNDTVINGRLQKATRPYSYRLRIFGKDSIKRFQKFINFQHKQKRKALEDVLNSEFNYEKDLIPARDLILEHLEENFFKKSYFREVTNVDLWNCLKKQDCRRDTLMKLIGVSHNLDTSLVKLLESPVRWCRVSEVKKSNGGVFREIEVEDPHAYIGCGVISHNCNFPARRVIILGVHRGLDEVATYDITQMMGRAGRVGYDPCGDAYILLPQSKFDYHKSRLIKPQKIKSQMLDDSFGHHKVLAFHLVSEIHHGNIRTVQDIHEWYDRSLAHWQENELEEDIIEKTIDLLRKCGAVYEDEEGILSATSIGKISSLFYYSPFDVSDLKKNFQKLFENHDEKDDHCLAMALGDVDTQRMGIVSRLERENMGMFLSTSIRRFPNVYEPSIKAGFCYHQLLHGRSNPVFAGYMRSLQMDFPRLVEVLNAIDGMSAKWNKRDWFRKLDLRVKYGVRGDLVYLCEIPNVGKVRAEKLWKAGLRTISDVANNPGKVQEALKFKSEHVAKMCEDAASLL